MREFSEVKRIVIKVGTNTLAKEGQRHELLVALRNVVPGYVLPESVEGRVTPSEAR